MCSDPRNSDMNLEGFTMSKLTKKDKIHIFEEWTLENKRGTYLSKKYGIRREKVNYLINLIKIHGLSVLDKSYTHYSKEYKEHAIKRNASIIAEIEGVVTNFGNNIDAYTQCVERLLEQHNLEYSDIDLYIPEGCAEEKSDNIEAKFIDKKLAKQTLITVPKAAYGSLYGASTSTDIVSASIFMEEAKVSRTIGDYETIRNINILRNNTKKRIQRVLIMSRSREGSNVAILLRKN